MKKMNWISTTALSAAILMSGMTAYAATTGSITIDNAIKSEDYKVYKILDLESYDTAKKTYAYTADADWSEFLNSAAIKGTYVSFTDQYVTWVEGADAADFAELATAYANEKNLTADKTVTATAGSVSMTDLPLGYYLLDSTVGTICSLDTNDPDVTIKEKNSIPTITKEVREARYDTWGAVNCASIGDTVNFHSHINVGDGAIEYVVHDQMEDGLTFTTDSVKITMDGNAVSTDKYTVKTEGLTDGCDFEIEFKDSFLATLDRSDSLVITYDAVLNKDAEIADEHNDNTIWLAYGEKQSITEKHTTKTYTYAFDLIKTDKDGKVLTGAKFSLYDSKTGGNVIKLVKVGEEAYRVAEKNETEGVVTEIEAGKPVISGLGSGAYYLEETQAPQGYNKLTKRVEVVIEEANNYGTIGQDQLYQSGGVQIINNSGLRLPSTGGMGTTIFYLAGVIVILCASEVLLKKKSE